MSMYQRHINEATAQIERLCSEMRECASKLVESAPSASTNKQSAPCFSCAKWGGCWRGINAVSPKCFVSK